MELVSIRAANGEHMARSENEVQDRYAIKAIQVMQRQVAEQVRLVQEMLDSEPDVLNVPYLSTRLKGLTRLERRLGNAWGEVAGVFDEDEA